MSLSTWRQFQFFESTPIRDPLFGTDDPLYSDPTLSAAAPIDDNQLAIAVQSNVIKIIFVRESRLSHKFQAFDDGFQITYLQIIDRKYLVAVAESLGKPSLIKIYKLDKLPSDETLYHTLIEVKNGNNTFPISVISVSLDLSCIVVGYVSGKVLLIRGDISRDRGSRQRIIYDDIGKEPITSLFLNTNASVCYASTTSRVMLFNTTGRNSGQPDLVLNSELGLNLHCGYYNPSSNEYISCFNNLIEFYSETGERHSIACNGASIKRVFPINKKYILIVSEAELKQTTVLDLSGIKKSTSMKVLILDISSKFVVFNQLVPTNIIDIFLIPGSMKTFLFTPEGLLYRIAEKSYEDQVDLVIQKEMFPFALQLAERYSMAPIKVQEIHKSYGDFLFKKKQLTESVEQYIQALDVVETCEIISQFGIGETPNSTSLRNLGDYLWSLVKNGYAQPDHITLLLIVLIKLKDTEQINIFINQFSRAGRFSETIIEDDIDDDTYFYSDQTLFNLNLVITLLEESNFAVEAYTLAQRFAKDPTKVVEILLGSLNNPLTALEYIRCLSVDDALRVLVTFSKQLLEELPNDTNALLIDIFTGKFKPVNNFKSELQPSVENKETTDVRRVFYSYTSFLGYTSENSKTQVGPTGEAYKSTYHPPKPSLIFNAFIARPFEFVVFLEACLDTYQKYGGLDDDKQIIYTTLYDLYLTLANDDTDDRRKTWKEKAKAVLDQSNKLTTSSENSSRNSNNVGNPIDNSLMMLISHLNNIDISSIDEISENNNINVLDKFNNMILTCSPIDCLEFFEQNVEKEEKLYCEALSYFISSKEVLKEIGGATLLKEKVLNNIIEKSLMPILDLIQLLSSTSVANYGMIQNLLITYVKDQDDYISRNTKLIESYESELRDKREELEKLLKPDIQTEIKIKNQECSMCDTFLQLPIVFFKCNHIYHQRCSDEEIKKETGESFYSCPKCAADFESSDRLAESQKSTVNNSNLLKMTLADTSSTEDGFKIVTDFIGRGGLDYAKMNM